jgi:hypothetical protein
MPTVKSVDASKASRARFMSSMELESLYVR